MAVIRGSVMLRPARVGLVVSNPNLGTLQRAAQMATSAWGGIYFPIINVGKESDHRRLIERLSIDVLWPVDENTEFDLLDQPGFRWRGRTPYGPFDPPTTGLTRRLLDSRHLAAVGRMETAAPSWVADDELASLFALWFGDFPADDYGVQARRLFAGHANRVVVQRGAVIDMQLARWITPVAATGVEIDYTGDGPGPSIVIIDPTSPRDLIRFWNVRAAGAEVLPWVVGAEDRFEPILRPWLSGLLAAGEVPRLRRADGSADRLYINLWPGSAAHDLQSESLRGLIALLDDYGVEVLPGHFGRGSWYDQHPLSTPYRRRFKISLEPQADWAELELPALNWATGSAPSSWPGVIAADLEMRGEQGLDPERTSVVPRVRRLAALLDNRDTAIDTFHRPNGRGGVYSVSAADETLTIRLAHPVTIFEHMLNRPDWRCTQSDDGRFAARLDHRLGGPDSQLALQPAVREILLRSAVRGDMGVGFPVLQSLAVNARGTWPDSPIDQRKPAEYVRHLIWRLTEIGLLRTVLAMTCPSCRNLFSIPPADLGDEITCGFCDHRYPLALALAWLGPKAPWHYRIAGHVSPEKLLAALPVIATGTVLATLLRGGLNVTVDVVGLAIHERKKPLAEFDIATVIDTVRPTAVLGEIKGQGASMQTILPTSTSLKPHYAHKESSASSSLPP